MDPNRQINIAGALTFPSRNEQPVPVQPRQPRNLQGLLRFAMEATKIEDAPGNSELGPMDEERRKFLEEALKSLTVNVAAVLQESIKVLSDEDKIKGILSGADLPEDVARAFDNLMEYIDDIDIANDFYKIGGYKIFPVCNGSENNQVRSRAYHILAELCQNNPFCQAKALECGLLNILIRFLETEQEATLAKCILAVSCVCREFEPAIRQLVAEEGCEALMACLSEPHVQARTKAAFLIHYLCCHSPEAKEKFVQAKIVRILAEQINLRRDESSEHYLRVLHTLIESSDPKVTIQCRDPSLHLKTILKDHLYHPDLKDDTFIEEKTYCKDIIKFINSFPPIAAVDEEVDR